MCFCEVEVSQDGEEAEGDVAIADNVTASGYDQLYNQYPRIEGLRIRLV